METDAERIARLERILAELLDALLLLGDEFTQDIELLKDELAKAMGRR